VVMFVHLLLSWPYSPMVIIASSVDLFRPSVFLDLCLQFLILHFIITACAQSFRLFLGLPVSLLP
jgi:hypothetical protein